MMSEIKYSDLLTYRCPEILYSISKNRFKVQEYPDLIDQIFIVKDGFTILTIWIDDTCKPRMINMSMIDQSHEDYLGPIEAFSKRFLDDDNFIDWYEIKNFIDRT